MTQERNPSGGGGDDEPPVMPLQHRGDGHERGRPRKVGANAGDGDGTKGE